MSRHSCNLDRKRSEIQYFSNPFYSVLKISYKFFSKNVAKMLIEIQMDFEARFTFQIRHQYKIFRTSLKLISFFFFLDLRNIYIYVGSLHNVNSYNTIFNYILGSYGKIFKYSPNANIFNYLVHTIHLVPKFTVSEK